MKLITKLSSILSVVLGGKDERTAFIESYKPSDENDPMRKLELDVRNAERLNAYTVKKVYGK